MVAGENRVDEEENESGLFSVLFAAEVWKLLVVALCRPVNEVVGPAPPRELVGEADG